MFPNVIILQVLDGKLLSNHSVSFENKIKMYAEGLTSDVRLIESIMDGAHMVREKLLDAAKQQIKISHFGLLSDAILFERNQPDDRKFQVRTNSFLQFILKNNARTSI